jgi:hypothetical protein
LLAVVCQLVKCQVIGVERDLAAFDVFVFKLSRESLRLAGCEGCSTLLTPLSILIVVA